MVKGGAEGVAAGLAPVGAAGKNRGAAEGPVVSSSPLRAPSASASPEEEGAGVAAVAAAAVVAAVVAVAAAAVEVVVAAGPENGPSG